MEPVEDVETRARPGAMVRLKVVPGGSKDEILGRHGDRVRVKVAAPPEAGKANKAVVALLAKRLGLPRSAVSIERGHGTPLKTARIEGLDAASVGRALYGEA